MSVRVGQPLENGEGAIQQREPFISYEELISLWPREPEAEFSQIRDFFYCKRILKVEMF